MSNNLFDKLPTLDDTRKAVPLWRHGLFCAKPRVMNYPHLSRLIVCLLAVSLASASARGQLRVVTYNTLDKPADSTEDSQFNTIFTAIGTKSINGIAKRVDLLAVQEQRTFGSTSTAQEMADLLNGLYGVTTYAAALTGFGTDVTGVVYDTTTVELISQTNVFTSTRRSLRGQFRPVGYTDSSADLYLYSSHFKAGSTSSDVSTRALEGTQLSNNAASLGSTANYIFAGDFNVGSGEQAFANLLGASNDPIQLATWPNPTASSSSAAVHMTQSTRTFSLPDEGATGGMDDRFDMQLVSDNLFDGEGLSYLGPTSTGLESLAHSYQAFGNDGVSWNSRINNTFLGRSQPANVLNALHDFSDHLPVVADYQLPAVMDAAINNSIPLTLNLNEEFFAEIVVENIANVVASVGADELDYTITFTGDLLGTSIADIDLALGGGNLHQLQLDTTSIGSKSATITIESSSQAVQNSFLTLDVSFEVIAQLEDADFNADDTVDGADLLIWQQGFPSGTTLGEGDANSDGTVNDLDLAIWQQQYGDSQSLVTQAVPEPMSLLLVGIVFSLSGVIRRKSQPNQCGSRFLSGATDIPGTRGSQERRL